MDQRAVPADEEGTYDRRQEEMVRQELHFRHVDMLFEFAAGFLSGDECGDRAVRAYCTSVPSPS